MKKAIFLSITLTLSLMAAAQAPQKTAPAAQQRSAQTEESKIFTVLEEAPEFTGGLESLYQFLAANIKYPSAGDVNVNGKIIVSFVIEKDGTVSDAKVVRKLHPAFDAEALRVVKLMPKWEPGRQEGMPVRVQFHLPINFSLN